jgi:two-component system, cell cycle sensor histidine kinase and response regulator CckA
MEAFMSRETVLIVDDEPGILNLVAVVLWNRGYAVLKARDADSALQLAMGHPGPIDLLLTDVRMPAMSGPELCERLRKVRTETRYLLMSASIDGGEGLGIPFLAKPFGIPELLRSVQASIGKCSGQPEPVGFARSPPPSSRSR